MNVSPFFSSTSWDEEISRRREKRGEEMRERRGRGTVRKGTREDEKGQGPEKNTHNRMPL